MRRVYGILERRENRILQFMGKNIYRAAKAEKGERGGEGEGWGGVGSGREPVQQ